MTTRPMAAKEPTVELLRASAKELVAEVERAAAERAWDEGFREAMAANTRPVFSAASNPYRLPKGPKP